MVDNPTRTVENRWRRVGKVDLGGGRESMSRCSASV